MDSIAELSRLPRDILVEILSHVSPKDLFHTFLVCKSLSGVSNEDLLWKPHFITFLNKKSAENNRHMNFPLPTSEWKHNYKLLISEKCYGYPQVFPNASCHSAGFLLGFHIEITHICKLKYFGLIAKNNKHDAQMVMGLYNEKKSKPSALVASTKMITLEEGRMEIMAFSPSELDNDVPTTPIILKPGHYTLMAVYTKDASVGEHQVQPQTNSICYTGFPLNDSNQRLPLQFAKTHSKYQGNFHNYYIVTTSL